MLMNDNQYLAVIEEIKAEIERARYRAAVSLNRELCYALLSYRGSHQRA